MSLSLNLAVASRAAAAALLMLALGTTTFAQQQKPTADAVEAARQIVALKGGDAMFAALIPGVIQQGKSMFEQQNPALGKDLSAVAEKLRTELAPRATELNNEIAKAYASHFTEQELKDMLAFYQSPLGRKMIVEEPKALAESVNYAQQWSNKFSDEVITKIRQEMKKLGHDI